MKSFLMIDKTLLSNEELNATDIIIIAQVQEYIRTTGKCFVSNDTFAKMCGCSESTIKRAIDKLVKSGYLSRETIATKEGRKRTLSLPQQEQQEQEIAEQQENKEFIF